MSDNSGGDMAIGALFFFIFLLAFSSCDSSSKREIENVRSQAYAMMNELKIEHEQKMSQIKTQFNNVIEGYSNQLKESNNERKMLNERIEEMKYDNAVESTKKIEIIFNKLPIILVIVLVPAFIFIIVIRLIDNRHHYNIIKLKTIENKRSHIEPDKIMLESRVEVYKEDFLCAKCQNWFNNENDYKRHERLCGRLQISSK